MIRKFRAKISDAPGRFCRIFKTTVRKRSYVYGVEPMSVASAVARRYVGPQTEMPLISTELTIFKLILHGANFPCKFEAAVLLLRQNDLFTCFHC